MKRWKQIWSEWLDQWVRLFDLQPGGDHVR